MSRGIVKLKTTAIVLKFISFAFALVGIYGLTYFFKKEGVESSNNVSINKLDSLSIPKADTAFTDTVHLYINPKQANRFVVKKQEKDSFTRFFSLAFRKININPDKPITVHFGRNTVFPNLEQFNDTIPAQGVFRIVDGRLIINEIVYDHTGRPMVWFNRNELIISKKFIDPDGTFKFTLAFDSDKGVEITDQYGIVAFSLEIVNDHFYVIQGYRMFQGYLVIMSPLGRQYLSPTISAEELKAKSKDFGIKPIFNYDNNQTDSTGLKAV